MNPFWVKFSAVEHRCEPASWPMNFTYKHSNFVKIFTTFLNNFDSFSDVLKFLLLFWTILSVFYDDNEICKERNWWKEEQDIKQKFFFEKEIFVKQKALNNVSSSSQKVVWNRPNNGFQTIVSLPTRKPMFKTLIGKSWFETVETFNWSFHNRFIGTFMVSFYFCITSSREVNNGEM